jgi:hypothetical protein
MSTNIEVFAWFLIPFLIVLASHLLSGQHTLKYTTGVDLFTLLISADLGAVVEYDSLRQRVNPTLRQHYLSVFGLLLAVLFVFFIVSGLTQRSLEAWRDQHLLRACGGTIQSPPPAAKYPLVGVLASWVSVTALIPAHLFVFFGKA